MSINLKLKIYEINRYILNQQIYIYTHTNIKIL